MMPYNLTQSIRRPGQTQAQNPALQGLQQPQSPFQQQPLQQPAPMTEMQSQVGGRAALEGLVREMQRNMQRNPGGSGATQADVDYFQGGLEDSPSFGNKEIARQQGFQDDYQSAVRSGFRGMDPVADAARYGRNMEQYKIDAPARQQEIAGQYGVREAQAAGGASQNSALLNFLGRQQTSQGNMQSRQMEALGRVQSSLIEEIGRLSQQLSEPTIREDARNEIMVQRNQFIAELDEVKGLIQVLTTGGQQTGIDEETLDMFDNDQEF